MFWYAKLFHNNREIAEFRSPEELENFVLQKGLPSARGLPYLGGE